MGFFSKLFGSSDNSQNKPTEVNETISQSVELVSNTHDCSPFSDFFGVDMLNSPDKDWKLVSVSHNTERVMTFVKELEMDPEAFHVFDHCEALVIGDSFTNFIFEAPYNYDLLAKAFYFIEKNFVDITTTMLRTTVKYEFEMKEYNYDPSLSFDLKDDSLCMQYMRNRANGNMKFIIRTSNCFKELDYDQIEKEYVAGLNQKQVTSTNETVIDAESDDKASKIYIPTEDGSYRRASFSGKNMSFNDINERLGVRTRLYYVWFTQDLNINICLKAFSKDIICIVSNNDLGDVLSASYVNSLMERDGFEYDSAFDIYSREHLLEDGISGKFLTQSFMEEATHMNSMGNVLVDTINGYTYIFENGLLKAYTSSDGLIGQAKQMKDTPIYNIVKANAKKIYSDDHEVIKELNAQFKAYSHIPMDQLKLAPSYSYNYCKYYLENCNPNLNQNEFLEYTHDQAQLIENTVARKTYKFGDKVYTFDELGNIVYGSASSGRKAHLMAHDNVETDLDVIYSKNGNGKVKSISLEIESEDSAIRIAINFCETKTKGEESKYFSLNAIGNTIVARDVYTQEYYFTTHSVSLARLLQSGKQYLGSVTDIDISEPTSPIFEISFMAIGE